MTEYTFHFINGEKQTYEADRIKRDEEGEEMQVQREAGEGDFFGLTTTKYQSIAVVNWGNVTAVEKYDPPEPRELKSDTEPAITERRVAALPAPDGRTTNAE